MKENSSPENIHTTEYYSAIKTNELRVHATWMGVKIYPDKEDTQKIESGAGS